MKRVLVTLGVVGLTLLSVPAPANADADFKLCHHGRELWIDVNGGNALAGHTRHDDDIIPPNELLPGGLNWNEQGMADYANGCAPVTLSPVVVEQPAPVEQPVLVDPPAVVDPPAPVEQPVLISETPVTLTPSAPVPAPQAAAPQGAVAKAPAAAVSRGTNQGFNAQTAVGGTEANTTWLAGLGLLLGAAAVVAVRRKSRTESPTAG